jgi:nucleoside phosphorylase
VFPAARVAPIGTSARVGGTSGCDVEAMEGYAVLRAASLAGVPAVEIRATANGIGEPDRSKWRFEEAKALMAEAIPLLLREVVGAG